MSELKPCPFCGSDGKVSCRNFMSSIEDLELDDVMCEKCGIYFETYTRDDVDAVTLWNHRPIEDAKDKEIERLKEALKRIADFRDLNPNMRAIDYAVDVETELQNFYCKMGDIAKQALANAPDSTKGAEK